MNIRSVLRHRCVVKRATTTTANGTPTTHWSTVAEDVACLLDTGTVGQPDPTISQEAQRALDRTGTLFTLPDADLQPADRITLTRGQSGNFVVKPDPARVSTLTGVSHCEHRVIEVP